MSSHFGTVGICALGVGINSTYAIAHKDDPFPTIMAGALFTGACVLVGSASPEIGTAVAALYLLSTALTRGEYFIGFVEDVAGAKPAKTPRKKAGKK